VEIHFFVCRLLGQVIMTDSSLPAPQLAQCDYNDKGDSTGTARYALPRVVRLKRSRGKIIQDCDIYIGRQCTLGGWNLATSKWANPFSIASVGSAAAAVSKYRSYILKRQHLLDCLPELSGKVLGCWCKPNVCHGDVLVELFKERLVEGNEI
jgi:hypothetical protein